MITWACFSKEELFNAIKSCNNSLTPRLDRLSWRYLKEIVKDKEYTKRLIDIANTCIDLGYWPSHFKISSMLIISKPNKTSYNLSKSLQPIMLLNTTGKLFEKVIGERIQFFLISNDSIHSCQLGRLKHILLYTSPPVRETTSPWWCHFWTIQARLPWQPPFS